MAINIFRYLGLGMFFMTAYGLFAIKDKVSTLSYQLNSVNKQVEQERGDIHMLKAEVAYLSSPDRLRKLATNYLGLDSIKTPQMIKNPLVSNNSSEEQNISIDNISLLGLNKHNVKWRYKKAPSKYLQTISSRR